MYEKEKQEKEPLLKNESDTEEAHGCVEHPCVADIIATAADHCFLWLCVLMIILMGTWVLLIDNEKMNLERLNQIDHNLKNIRLAADRVHAADLSLAEALRQNTFTQVLQPENFTFYDY